MYKLCGGTLLVLLLNSSKTDIKETDLLKDMLRVLYPKCYINDNTLKEQTKKFKMCREHSSLANDFEDTAKMMEITEGIHKNYKDLLERTATFIEDYIDTDSDTRKDEFLVKAILEVIKQDESIPDNHEFYIFSNGKSVTKKQLVSIKTVYLPSFILGILYYVMMNIKDNRFGAETYDKWCPKPDSGTRRKYTANLGENSTRQIVLLNAHEEYDHCDTSRIEQSEMTDVNDTEVEVVYSTIEVPSKIPFIKKKQIIRKEISKVKSRKK